MPIAAASARMETETNRVKAETPCTPRAYSQVRGWQEMRPGSQQQTSNQQRSTLAQHKLRDLDARSTDCQTNSNFAQALSDDVQHDAIEAEGRDEKRERCKCGKK